MNIRKIVRKANHWQSQLTQKVPALSRSDDFYPEWLKHRRQRFIRKYNTPIPQRLTATDVDDITTAASNYTGTLNRIRPHKDENGLEYATELIEALHQDGVAQSPIKKKAGIGTRPRKYTFEIVFVDGQIKFYIGLPSQSDKREFRQQLNGLYPASEVKPGDDIFSNVSESMYAAYGRVEKNDHKYIPVRSFEQPAVFEHDPYRALLAALAGPESHLSILQFVFTPAEEAWTDGLLAHEFSIDQAHESLTYGRVNSGLFHTTLEDPSDQDLRAAEAILEVEDSPAFYLNTRYAVFGPRKDFVKPHVESIGNQLQKQFHNGEAHQGFTPLHYNGEAMFKELKRLAGREFVYNQDVVTADELSGLAHLPGEEITANAIDWTRRGIGNAPPAQAPRTTAPPSMEVDRDLDELDADDAAVGALPGGEEVDYAGVGPEDAGPLTSAYGSIVQTLSRATPNSDSDDDDTSGDAGATATEDASAETGETTKSGMADQINNIESKERQEAFNEIYNQFLEGELTRAQIRSQYNENVADNLIRKFRERRAEELGIALEELEEYNESLFGEEETDDADGSDEQEEQAADETATTGTSSTETSTNNETDTPTTDPNAETPGGTTPATQAASPDGSSPATDTVVDPADIGDSDVTFEVDADESATETTATDADSTDETETVTEGVTDLPDKTANHDNELTPDSGDLPSRQERARSNPAHHSNYAYDQASTDVTLRREPGLNQQFPFEIRSYASGDGVAQEGDVFSGFDVRDRLINHHSLPEGKDEPIWLGYDTNPLDGLREVGLEPLSWFQHMTVFGTTGKGKSTFLNIFMNQIARKGYGFVFIDPKGDTVDDLITQLPEERMDDVVWIEPGSETFEKVAGINFLEPGNAETENELDREIESIVEDLQAILRSGDYWGPKMAGITENFARAMIRSRRKFTLVDMYHVLADRESRLKFANMVSQEGLDFIHEYTRKIANMDEEAVDPVLRRIQSWVEDPISRGVVAHRKGTINISDAVEDGKIILVRNTLRSEDVRQVVSTAIMRRVWATIRKREKLDEADREPFFAIMDEFDDIASEDMALDKMLSKARSGKMSVTTCLQNPSQIREFAPQTLKQLFGNVNTMFSFGVTETDDARLIAKRFNDDSITDSTFLSLPRYTAVTSITTMDEDGPMISDPLALDTFPDYPPIRTTEEANERISENLSEYGVDPLEEDLQGSDNALMNVGGDADVQTAFLEAVWAEQIRQDAIDTLPPAGAELDPNPACSHGIEADPPPEHTVAVEDVIKGFEKRTNEAFENLPDGVLIEEPAICVVSDDDDGDEDDEQQQRGRKSPTRATVAPEDKIRINDPETEVAITDYGIRTVLEKAPEENQPETEEHAEALRQAFVALSAIGMEMRVVEQEHSDELPDAVARPPIPSEVETTEAERLLEEFEREYPTASQLSEGQIMAIEAETSTFRKPARTLTNLARAVNNDQKVLFITPDEHPDWSRAPAARLNNILTEPAYVRGELRVLPNEDEDDANDIENRSPMPLYYNKSDHLELGLASDTDRKHPLIKKGKEAVWVRTGENELTLYDGLADASRQGSMRIDERYGSTNAFEVWTRYDPHNQEWVVYPGGQTLRYETLSDLEDEWQLVYEPFVPEREFQNIPSEDAWEIAQLPIPEFLIENEESDNAKQDTEGQREDEAGQAELSPCTTPAELDSLTDEDQHTSDPGLRLGYTREAVPLLEHVITSELPSTAGGYSGGGTESLPRLTDEMVEPLISREYQPAYDAVSALVLDENDADELTVERGDSNTATEDSTQASTTPPTDETDTAESPESPASDTQSPTSPAGAETATATETEADTDTDTDDDSDIDDFEVSMDPDAFDDPDGDVDPEDIEILTDDDKPAPTTITIPNLMSEAAIIDELPDEYISNSSSLPDSPTFDDVSLNTELINERFKPSPPTNDRYWRVLWMKFNLADYEAVERDKLPYAVEQALFDGEYARDRILVGLIAGGLRPVGEDGEAVRLPGPRDEYEKYLTPAAEQAVRQYTHWQDIFEKAGAIDGQLTVAELIDFEKVFGDREKETALAAIGVGVEAGVLVETGTEIALGDPRPPLFWRHIVAQSEETADEPTFKEILLRGFLEQVYDYTPEQIDTAIELGQDHGALIAHDEGQAPAYTVNNPQIEGGPEIDPEAFDPEAYPGNAAEIIAADRDDDTQDDEPPSSDTDGDDPDDPDGGAPRQTAPSSDTAGTPTDNQTEQNETANAEQQHSAKTADGQQATGDTLEAPAQPDTNPTTTPEHPESEQTPTDQTPLTDPPGSDTSAGTPATQDPPADGSQGVDPSTTETATDAEPTTLPSERDIVEAESVEYDAYASAFDEPRAEPNSEIMGRDPAALRLDPTPDPKAIQACLAAAAEFFHQQATTTIQPFADYNASRDADAPYGRKPETAREYFTRPATAPAVRALDTEQVVVSADGDTLGPVADVADEKRAADTTHVETHTSPTARYDTWEAFDDATDDGTPYEFETTDTRGWTDATVDELKLGWAPIDETALFEHLWEQGFKHHTMVATGLFTRPSDVGGENDDGKAYVDYTQPVGDSDRGYDGDRDPYEPLSTLFGGRYVFPYWDEHGRITYFIARKPDWTGIEGTNGSVADWEDGPLRQLPGKYAKLAHSKPYTITSEPIYGLETVEPGEPLVVTEGMPDAISAHQQDIPCISPVTTQFKHQHEGDLINIIDRYEIPAVYFLQDADPPSISQREVDGETRRAMEREWAIRELFSQPLAGDVTREQLVTAAEAGDTDRLESLIDGLTVAPPADPDEPADTETQITVDELPFGFHTEFNPAGVEHGSGPISRELTLDPDGSGVKGAATTARALDTATADRSDSTTGSLAAAAAVSADAVADKGFPLPDEKTLRERYHERLAAEGISLDDEDNEDEDERVVTDQPTDVYLVELPQFGDEKRDLDDYLTEGWLGLMPPAGWRSAVTAASTGGSTPPTVPSWAEALVSSEGPRAHRESTEETPWTVATGQLFAESVLLPPVHELTASASAMPDTGWNDSRPPYGRPYAAAADIEAKAERVRTSYTLPVETREKLAAQYDRLIPAEADTAYPALGLFGVLPSIHARQHPAGSKRSTRSVGGVELDVDPQEVDERVAAVSDADDEEDAWRKLTGKHNPLWQLDLGDLGFSAGDRGKNPLGHFGDSENYFVVHEASGGDLVAYDHKRKAVFNFVHFALCDMGERDDREGVGGKELSEYETFKVWEYARKHNLVSKHTPVPYDGLIGVALAEGIIDEATLAERRQAKKAAGDDEEAPDLIQSDEYGEIYATIENQTGYLPGQAQDDRAGESGDSTGGSDDDTPTDEERRERAIQRFGKTFLPKDDTPEEDYMPPLEQFLLNFVETEDGEPAKDKEQGLYVPRSDVVDAYNTWVRTVQSRHTQITDTTAKEMAVETIDAGNFVHQFEQAVGEENVERAYLSYESDGRLRSWWGVTLTPRGEELLEYTSVFSFEE